MATIATTSVGASVSAPSFFAGVMARIKNFMEQRAAIDALRSMDDRQLHDLGVTRGDIEYFAKSGVAPR